MDGTLQSLVHPSWPPLRHVERGWRELTPAEQDQVRRRVEAIVARHAWGSGARDSLAHLFTFLAQVETIAIEIPLRALPTATPQQAILLRRQLCDEVVHSVLFSRLAHDLAQPRAQPPAPLASAERLLEGIRREPDAAVSATLLNLVAEAWIETLFHHARRWGVADAVFDAVLADEERHVQEAADHIVGLDAARAGPAVRRLEQGLLEVGAEPTVALAMLDLAGADAYGRLADDLAANHRAQLAKVGLEPGPALSQRPPSPATAPAAKPIADTPWRQAARQVWSTPTDPTMQGAMELRVGHIPKRLLTPVLIAAIGRAWAKHPRLNRVVARGRVWQLAKANVGVRVLVAEDELSTVVIPDADTRSVADIQRLLVDGHRQLLARRERRMRDEAASRAAPAPSPEAMALLGPNAASFSVALSNPGKFGLESGAGAFSGTLSPSTDLTVGVRARKPAWFGVAYLPAWQVPLGCLQDHRVFDGREAGEAMQALRAELTPAAVRRLLRAPDTLPSEALDSAGEEARWLAAMPPELRLLPTVGLWKYFPVVAGGTALAAGLGIGGYLIVQNLNAAAATGAASAGAAGAAGPAGTAGTGAAAAPSAASSALAPAAAAAAHGSAITASGEPCQRVAEGNGLCWQHGGH